MDHAFANAVMQAEVTFIYFIAILVGILGLEYPCIWVLMDLCKTPSRMYLHMRTGCSSSRPIQQFDLGLNLSAKKTRKREFLE